MASNAYNYLHTELSLGGNMYNNYGGVAIFPTNSEIMSLALYIGQFKAPSFTVANGSGSLTMAVRAGAPATKDIYPLLATGTGGAAQDSGGLSKTNGSNGTVSVTQVGATTTMNYNATYTSTAGYTGTDSFDVSVINPISTATRTIAVTVLGITSATSVTGFKGQTYTAGSPIYQIMSNDGTASNFSASGLPTGLSVDSTNGKITGTTTATGSFSVTIGAQINGSINNGTVSKTLTMDIVGITNSSTANYTQNSVISTFQITTYPASPSAFGLTGSLPTGLSFASGSGQITGTPTMSGSYPVTLQATTTAGAVSQSLTINVASAGPPTISTSPASNTYPTPTVVGTVGTPISTITVAGTNPPLTPNSFTASGLPPGLSINSGTGVISGTPTTSGDYSVTLGASNSSGAGSLQVLMRVHATAATTLTSANTAGGTVGQVFSTYNISTSGNGPITSYTVSSGTLPGGLSLNSSTGAITGTPTNSGVFTVSLGATNSGGLTGTLSVTFTIQPNTVPTVTTSPAMTASPTANVVGTVGSAISTINVNGNNLPLTTGSYTASGLPPGLSIDANTGAITGTPTTSGDYTATLGVSNSFGPGTVSYVMRVNATGAPTISSANTASGTKGIAATQYTITTDGSNGPIASYAASGLPAGLTVNTSTGAISGTPTTSGVFSVTVSALNTGSVTGSKTVTFTIQPNATPVVSTSPALTASPTPNVVGSVGTGISAITVAGSNPPLTANSFTASGLPPGLSINTGTGIISGTPTTSGDYSVTLGVSNVVGAGGLTVVMRVNATGAPTITSSSTANGVLGTAGTQYTITTSGNGPISSYSVTGTLPAGLTLNTTTGVVSGTPSAAGNSTVTVNALNTGGQTGSKSVTFTIAPVIASPANGTTVALAIGAVMTPITITGSNPPLSSFAIASGSLPTGVSLNTGTGVISGTPTVPSASAAVTISAVDNAGTSGSVTLNLSVGVPAPGTCTVNTTLNTATTIDLKACMFPALTPTGFTLAVQPAHGSLSISGTSAVYTPANNFFGTDSFTAVGRFTGGTSSTAGTVTISVTGKPDPTQDKTVTALVAAQIAASQQIVTTQISNFGKHMEALVQRSTSGSARATNNTGTGFASRSNTTTGLELKPSNTLSQLNAIGANNATQLPATNSPASLPLSSAVNMAAGQLGLSQNPLYNLATDFAQNRTVNLNTLSLGFNQTLTSEALPGPKVWAEGVVSFGVRDANGSVSAADFNSKGISVGVDQVLSDKLTVGMGIGYAQDTTNIGTDGSRNQARGVSVAVYGNYMVSQRGYVQGMLGVGALDFDMNRYVSAANAYAVSNRKGYQLFGSVGTGLEFRDKANMISPYVRMDFSTDKLGENTETGAGSYSLTYYDQTNSALQGTLGLRGESTHATPFGWAIPRARIEWRKT